jgi:hypothetical protein
MITVLLMLSNVINNHVAQPTKENFTIFCLSKLNRLIGFKQIKVKHLCYEKEAACAFICIMNYKLNDKLINACNLMLIFFVLKYFGVNKK